MVDTAISKPLSLIERLKAAPWVAEAAALLAGMVYLIQTVFYAHNQESILDEGAYLYKGYLYLTGKYFPFQDYGPWTNQMPLSYLIPGFIEKVFGPGLRTGRYLAICLGLLMLIGLWLLARRLGGEWWAAGAVAAVALNPALIKTYSIAVSQVLISCMLIWILVLVLAEDRKTWQLALGSFLAGAMLLTRMNMLPVIPFLLFYIFWQHGVRAGIISTIVCLLTVLIGHAVFWPNIMRLWASWLPPALTPFLSQFRLLHRVSNVWDPSITFEDRWLSFWQGYRANFIPLTAFLIFSLPFFFSRHWKYSSYRKMGIFISLLFGSLWLAHIWASLTKNYCVYCYTSYITFFAPLGLLLVILTNRAWQSRQAGWFSWVCAALVILITTSIGLGSSQDLGVALVELPMPRVKNLHLMPGGISLWGVLENRFGLPRTMTGWLIPTLAGAIVGVLLLVGIWLIYRRLRKNRDIQASYGLFIANGLLIFGLLLSPTVVLANQNVHDCSGDVIASNEAVGRYLARVIPPGSKVYWKGSLSVVPLLQAPGVELFSPQINGAYSDKIGGDPDELRKFGLWNSELANQWFSQADYVIIEERRYTDDWKQRLESGQFDELPRSSSTTPCKDKYRLRIFQRISD